MPTVRIAAGSLDRRRVYWVVVPNSTGFWFPAHFAILLMYFDIVFWAWAGLSLSWVAISVRHHSIVWVAESSAMALMHLDTQVVSDCCTSSVHSDYVQGLPRGGSSLRFHWDGSRLFTVCQAASGLIGWGHLTPSLSPIVGGRIMRDAR